MSEGKETLVFDSSRGSSIDPMLAVALMNNNGWNNMNPMAMMFMYPFIFPFMSMFGGFGGVGNMFGGFGGMNGGAGFLANQLNNDAGRELILQAVNGNRDAINTLATTVNSDFNSVNNAISNMNVALANVGSQVGMSGLQVINAIQAGDASLASKLAECCCENRLATCQQTNTLSSQIAGMDANVRLQLAQNEANDQLAVCQQTNALSTQADRNATSILNAIANQNTLITKEFCDLKERELQNKINTQGDIITQLRNQISNDNQTLLFNNAMKVLDDKIDAIAAKQPNTIAVQYPNVTAVNTTPYMGCAGGCGCNNNGYWG